MPTKRATNAKRLNEARMLARFVEMCWVWVGLAARWCDGLASKIEEVNVLMNSRVRWEQATRILGPK